MRVVLIGQIPNRKCGLREFCQTQIGGSWISGRCDISQKKGRKRVRRSGPAKRGEPFGVSFPSHVCCRGPIEPVHSIESSFPPSTRCRLGEMRLLSPASSETRFGTGSCRDRIFPRFLTDESDYCRGLLVHCCATRKLVLGHHVSTSASPAKSARWLFLPAHLGCLVITRTAKIHP